MPLHHEELERALSRIARKSGYDVERDPHGDLICHLLRSRKHNIEVNLTETAKQLAKELK